MTPDIKPVIDIVKCPYCENTITAEECICQDCKPLANIDIAIQSIIDATTILEENKPKINKSRQMSINTAIYNLNNL